MIFENALSKWSSVTNIEFEEIATGEPDIWFRFVRGAHGDPFPFRSPDSSVLAHAFYPMDSKMRKCFYCFLKLLCYCSVFDFWP